MKGLLVIGVAVKGDGGFGSCRAVMPYGGTSKQVSKKKRIWVRWLRGHNKMIGGDKELKMVMVVCKDMRNGSVVFGDEVPSCKYGDRDPLVGLVVACRNRWW